MFHWTMPYSVTHVQGGACRKRKEVPAEATITHVDDKEVLAVCIGCDKLITEQDDWFIDSNAVDLCGACLDAVAKLAHIEREMKT